MEMLLMIVGIVAALWFFGLVKALRKFSDAAVTIAETANDEVEAYAVIHANKTAKKLAELNVDADTWAKAQEALARVKELRK